MDVVVYFTDWCERDKLATILHSLHIHIRNLVEDYIPGLEKVTFAETWFVRGVWVRGFEN